jgi:proton-dependent oligopeptide transporter, POT family
MAAASPNSELFGQPKGLYICFFTELWERFSFYGMKALLFLYLTKYHLFGDAPSYDLIGAYGGMVYAMPLLGGLLADRYLGMRKAVVLGAVLLCLGHLGMAYEGHAAATIDGVTTRDTGALQVFYLSLALIVMGVGFLKPNISTIVGRLYPENDPRRDSGFTIFYAGINVGALFASLVCGFLGETYGWRYGFGAAGIGMLLGLAVFLWGQRYLHGAAEPRDPARLKARVAPLLNVEWSIYFGSLLGVVVVWQLLQYTDAVHGVMGLSLGAFLVWLGFFLSRIDRVARERMLALVALIVACLLFFTLYEQTYGSWIAFTDRMLGKDLFAIGYTSAAALPWGVYALLVSPVAMVIALRAQSAALARGVIALLGAIILIAVIHDVVLVPQTASSLSFLGAFFIVVLSPIFAWLWPWLAKRGRNPSKPTKLALGLMFAGLAFLPMIAAAQSAANGELASVWWLVLAYFILELGEMCLSPIGLSAVTQLSVPSVVSVMMGAWFLATAFSEVLAAQLGKLAAIELPADGSAIDPALAAAKYVDLFTLMLWIGLGSALLYVLLRPLIKRWMHGVE